MISSRTRLRRFTRGWVPIVAGQNETERRPEIVPQAFLRMAMTPGTGAKGELSEAVEQSIRHVMREFSHETDVREMAEAGGLSPFHFSRKFYHEMGMTPGKFLRRYRILQAMILLLSRKSKVADVAQAVGYNSHASFTRAFREVVGTHPSQFRLTGTRQFIPSIR